MGGIQTLSLTVAIATRNRRELLLRTLRRLRNDHPHVDVVVVDNGSEDGTPAAVRMHFADVTLVEAKRNYGSYARTIAAQSTHSDLLAFCDDDTAWEPGAFERAAEIFAAHPRVGLLCGRLLVEPEMRVDPVCEAMAASPLPRREGLPGPPILGFLACAAIVRRRAFVAAGGFHLEYGIGGEEELLAIDMADGGWALCYVDDLIAYHAPAGAGRDPYRRRAVQLRNKLWTAWLRRPMREAASITCRAVARNAGDPAAWQGFSEAMKGLSWVRRERRIASVPVRQQLRMLR